MNGIAAGQGVKPSFGRLIDARGNLAVLTVFVRVEFEDFTVLDSARIVLAFDGFFKGSRVPPIDEVTMKSYKQVLEVAKEKTGWMRLTVASRIAIREYKGMFSANPFTVPFLDAEENLIEQRHDALGMSRWAWSIFTANRIGNVGLVIRTVAVLSVPAAGKEYLGPETTKLPWLTLFLCPFTVDHLRRAFLVWNVICLRPTIAQAGVGNGILCLRIGVAPKVHISSKHTEIVRERYDFVLIRAIPLEIINRDPTVGNWVELVVLALDPKIWDPVIALVLRNNARCACSGVRLLSRHREIKSVATHDGMQMSRWGTRVDDGICTITNYRTVAIHLSYGYLYVSHVELIDCNMKHHMLNSPGRKRLQWAAW